VNKNKIDRRDHLKQRAVSSNRILTNPLFFDMIACSETPDAKNFFAERFDVTGEVMKKILQAAMSKGAEYADLYFEFKNSHSIGMEENIIKNTSEIISLGVGIRVVKGEQTGYGYTNDLSLRSMQKAAKTAAAIASESGKFQLADLTVSKPLSDYYRIKDDLSSTGLKEKIDMVEAGARGARKVSNKINQVSAFLTDEIQYITIATSKGKIYSDVRPMNMMYIIPKATSKKGVDVSFASIGGRVGKEYYTGENSPAEAGRRAAEDVLQLLEADYAPAGEMTVVCGAGQSGVMVHEAVGHPLEGDANYKKLSIMHDKLNKKVATDVVTIYDDPTIPNFRGSLNIDDEGVQPENAVLIRNGVLIDYIHDRMSAKLLKMRNNGHGRRQSYKYPPIPRMTNTAIANGQIPPEDILKTVKKGFFTKNFMGGQVYPNGKFVFSVSLGYLIEDGKLTRPLKNATIIGSNMEVLNNISMVGNDISYEFLGSCGKAGQTVPVSCGTPTLKIDGMTVGGRKA
jgi:TldD protein